MNKKAFSFIQHKLIPTALIAGNIALIHLIYLLAKEDYDYILLTIAVCIIALIVGIVQANKYLLMAGIVFYGVMLLSILIGDLATTS